MLDESNLMEVLRGWSSLSKSDREDFLEQIKQEWDLVFKNREQDILEHIIIAGDKNSLQQLFKLNASPNEFFCGTLSGLAIQHKQYECFEVIFEAGGRLQDEEIVGFSEEEKKFYFKFMKSKKPSLTAEEIVKLYELRWEIITRVVFKEKWEKNISENNIEVFKEIFEKNPGSFSEQDRIFNLNLSILENNAEILELLLQNNVNPNVFLADQSPLNLALSKKHHECVDILLDYGACLTNDEKFPSGIINEKDDVNSYGTEEIKKEGAEEDNQSLNDFLINDFNNANYNKTCMLQRFIKTGELKAANILISKNIHLDEEQIEGLDGAQKVIYNELINNIETSLTGEFNLLDIDHA